jgi:hypothetical protein
VLVVCVLCIVIGSPFTKFVLDYTVLFIRFSARHTLGSNPRYTTGLQ